MPDDELDPEKGVREWLARRIGENVPPRPRPTGPRPTPLPAPPITRPARSERPAPPRSATPPPRPSPPPRPAPPRPNRAPSSAAPEARPASPSASRPLTSTLVPRGETRRPPIAVGPSPERLGGSSSRHGDEGVEPSEWLPLAGRRTESEDTGSLLFEDTTAYDSEVGPGGPMPPEFGVDDVVPEDEAPTSEFHRLTRRAAGRSAWGGPTAHDIDPIEPFPRVVESTPPAPDAFTAADRFRAPDARGISDDPFPPSDPLDPPDRFETPPPLEAYPSSDVISPDEPFMEASDVLLEPLVTDEAGPTAAFEDPFARLGVETHDPESSSDPITRRIPPSDDEERFTSELHLDPESVPPASHVPTPTLEQSPPPAARAESHPPVEAVVVHEASETAKLVAPPRGFEAPGPAPTPVADLGVMGDVTSDRPVLFAKSEPDTVVLAEEPLLSRTGLWIVAGSAIGIIGFAIVVALLILWFWLLGT